MYLRRKNINQHNRHEPTINTLKTILWGVFFRLQVQGALPLSGGPAVLSAYHGLWVTGMGATDWFSRIFFIRTMSLLNQVYDCLIKNSFCSYCSFIKLSTVQSPLSPLDTCWLMEWVNPLFLINQLV